MLTLEQVNKFVLSNVTVHIPKGVAVGVIGASGAGKTTFLKLACGLLSPEAGKVYTFGKNPVKQQKMLGKQVGCLLENMSLLNGEHSVLENFRERQIVYRMSEVEFSKEYRQLTERFGICTLEQELVKNLSFGQRRRVELAVTLLHRPELLLLDEPTIGLDERAKTVLREVLLERVQEGVSVVMTSHELREVSQICQRLIVLEKGTLLYYGEEAVLLRQYAPVDCMRLKLSGRLPDMEDLPLKQYVVAGEEVTLYYNSNYITAAEILENVLRQTSVGEITIKKPELTEVIRKIEQGVKGENREGYGIY